MDSFNVWDSFNKSRAAQDATNLAGLTQATGVATLAGHLQKLQQEKKLRETLASLGSDATPDQISAAVRPFASASEIFKSSTDSETQRLSREATKESARARLQQAEALHNRDYELKRAQAATAEQKAAVDAWDKQVRAQIAGERLKYDTGATVPVAPPALQSQLGPQPTPTAPTGNVSVAPTVTVAELMRLPPADRAAAMGALQTGNSAPPTAQTPPVAAPVATPAPMAPVAAPTAPAPVSGAPTPLPTASVVAPPLDAQLGPRQLPQRLLDKAAADNLKSAGVQSAAPTRTADALRDDVYYQIMNGKPRAGSIPTGRNGEGNQYRADFANELNKVAKEIGKSPAELATLGAENKAKFQALGAQEKDLSAIRPYNDMLHTNGDIAIKLAEKAIATNSKIANKPLNWLRQNVGDNPDVADFLAQAQIVSTESARVLNNPRLVGQLTDSARHEMQGIVSGDMPIESFTRVIKRMQNDGNNRVAAMESQRKRTISEIRGEAPQSRATDKPGAVMRFDSQGNPVK